MEDKKELLRIMTLIKDRNLYYECPEEYKNDYDFLTKVIEIYKDDFAFVEEIAEAYVKKNIPAEEMESNEEYVELCMLMGMYVPEDYPVYEFYKERLEGIYKYFLLHVMMKKELDEEEVSNTGFSILVRDYEGRRVILDYFALRFIDELYHKTFGNFEDIVHLNCESAYNIEKEGFEDFFIRNLYPVDPYLSKYVFDNPHLLSDMVLEMEAICDNWDNYEEEVLELSKRIVKDWVVDKRENLTYGDDFEYYQAYREVIINMGLDRLFGIDRKFNKKSKTNVVSFGEGLFKKDLKKVVDTVFEKKTLGDLNNVLVSIKEETVKTLYLKKDVQS